MDLATLKSNMVNNHYASVTRFVAAFRSIVRNADVYSGDDSDIARLGLQLEMMFRAEIDVMFGSRGGWVKALHSDCEGRKEGEKMQSGSESAEGNVVTASVIVVVMQAREEQSVRGRRQSWTAVSTRVIAFV
ncbi:hypothetical protein MMC21_008228 [Puttea exsequens]|nr:hypothetical protein [Puttea exsequens]